MKAKIQLPLALLTLTACDMYSFPDRPKPPPLSAEPAREPAPELVAEPVPVPVVDPRLAARKLDYALALRTAAIKLIGTLPTREETLRVIDGASYAAQIDRYLEDPRFAAQIRAYFRDTMKMGGDLPTYDMVGRPVTVSLDTAPTFAALLATSDRSMLQLFTAPEGTCPTLDPATGIFTEGSCMTMNGLVTSGVLTDPGAMAQLYSSMAFRRVRWVQEVFACSAFPAEFDPSAGDGAYISPWPFESVSGGPDERTAPVDFQNTSGIVCANCHSTINHIAPLFANFDWTGQFQSTIQVRTPGSANFYSVPTDWIPQGENFAWRYGQNVSHLPGLGRAIAADPAVAHCFVARAWNWAMSKNDIVDGLALVPESTIAALSADFTAGGYRLKPMLSQIFKHEDFVNISWNGQNAAGDDPLQELARLEDPGASDIASRLGSCGKLKYTQLGSILASLGVNLDRVSTPPSAGELYRAGAAALGAPNYLSREREPAELSTSSAAKIFDIFLRAAPEVIDAMPSLGRCSVDLEPANMFDRQGHCTLEGITCLQGVPASEDERVLCDRTIALASTPELGRQIAVASILASAFTCE